VVGGVQHQRQGREQGTDSGKVITVLEDQFQRKDRRRQQVPRQVPGDAQTEQ